MLEESDFWKFYLDDVGEVRGSGVYSDGSQIEKRRLLQPPGFQTFPMDASESAPLDGLSWREGNTTEIVALSDRDAVSKLPKIQRGQSRMYSLDKSPQLVAVKSDEILVGKNATRGIARLDDEVGGVTVTIAGTQTNATTFSIQFTVVDAKGTTTLIGPFVIVGVMASSPLLETIKNISKITTASTLGKAE